jgi:hypothetical protein
MGTNIAADIVAENHVCNEQKLWRHVILNAFEDTRILSIDGQDGNRIMFDIDITKR